MPTGSVNFALAALVLTLKLCLLPRLWTLPAFACYIAASCVTTAAYLMAWRETEAAWSATVAVLGVLAAVEASVRVLWSVSDDEREAVIKWCIALGAVFLASGANAMPYDWYSTLIYLTRWYAALFSTGFLIGVLGFWWVGFNRCGLFFTHAVILVFRLGTMGAILLVHDRGAWWTADLIGGAVNLLTLGAWLWLIPVKAGIVWRKNV